MKKTIFILILIMIILGLGGYLVYDKFLTKEEVKEATVKEVEKIDDVGYDKFAARDLVSNIIDTEVYDMMSNLSKNGLTDEIRLSLAINKISDPITSYTCEDIFDLKEGQDYRPSQTQYWACNEPTTYLYDDVNTEYKKLFGKDTNAPKKGIYTTWAYEYSSKINGYIKLSPQFGPVLLTQYIFDVDKTTLKDNNLNIEISYLGYVYGMEDKYSFTINNENKDVSTLEEVEQAYKDNKDTLPKMNFQFNQKDGHYVLVGVGN